VVVVVVVLMVELLEPAVQVSVGMAQLIALQEGLVLLTLVLVVAVSVSVAQVVLAVQVL
jgi:hypothetical protein